MSSAHVQLPLPGIIDRLAMEQAVELAAHGRLLQRNLHNHPCETHRLVGLCIVVIGLVGVGVVGGLFKRLPLAGRVGGLVGSLVFIAGGVALCCLPTRAQPPPNNRLMMTYGDPPAQAQQWLGTLHNPVRGDRGILPGIRNANAAVLQKLGSLITQGERFECELSDLIMPITVEDARVALQAFQEKAGPGSELVIPSNNPKIIAPFIQAAYELGMGSRNSDFTRCTNGARHSQIHNPRAVWLYTDDKTDFIQDKSALPNHLRFYKSCPGVNAVCVTPQWMINWNALAEKVTSGGSN